MNINIITPNENHMPQILALNQKYLISHLTDSERNEGFIRIAYTESEMRSIIKAQEIVVAMDESKVVGYYLVGKKSKSEALNYQKNKAMELLGTHGISCNKIGYGCQVCIDTDYRNNGLFSEMLKNLTIKVKNVYSYLLCSISEDNLVSLSSHRNNGWELLNPLERTKYFTYKTQRPLI